MEEIVYLQTTFAGEYRERIIDLRYEVYVHEQKVPVELEIDEHDEQALHLVALLGGQVVGTARLVQGEDHLRVGRMAVKKPLRQKGVGSRLLEIALDFARQGGYQKVVLDSQVRAVKFYERYGFMPEGDFFDDAGIPHVRMVLTLG